jgi:hypothetical protein
VKQQHTPEHADPRPAALPTCQAQVAAHPEIAIRPPVTSPSRLWELHADDSTTFYDDFWAMIDHLSVLFGQAIT